MDYILTSKDLQETSVNSSTGEEKHTLPHAKNAVGDSKQTRLIGCHPGRGFDCMGAGGSLTANPTIQMSMKPRHTPITVRKMSLAPSLDFILTPRTLRRHRLRERLHGLVNWAGG